MLKENWNTQVKYLNIIYSTGLDKILLLLLLSPLQRDMPLAWQKAITDSYMNNMVWGSQSLYITQLLETFDWSWIIYVRYGGKWQTEQKTEWRGRKSIFPDREGETGGWGGWTQVSCKPLSPIQVLTFTARLLCGMTMKRRCWHSEDLSHKIKLSAGWATINRSENKKLTWTLMYLLQRDIWLTHLLRVIFGASHITTNNFLKPYLVLKFFSVPPNILPITFSLWITVARLWKNWKTELKT